MIKEKLVGENKKYKFFQNWLCKKYKGYNILLAKNKKNKERTYIIIKNRKVVGESNRIEDIYAKIDILNFSEKIK